MLGPWTSYRSFARRPLLLILSLDRLAGRFSRRHPLRLEDITHLLVQRVAQPPAAVWTSASVPVRKRVQILDQILPDQHAKRRCWADLGRAGFACLIAFGGELSNYQRIVVVTADVLHGGRFSNRDVAGDFVLIQRKAADERSKAPPGIDYIQRLKYTVRQVLHSLQHHLPAAKLLVKDLRPLAGRRGPLGPRNLVA